MPADAPKPFFLQNEDKEWRTEDDDCLWSNRDCSVASLALHHYRPPSGIRKRLQELSERNSSDSLDQALQSTSNDTTNTSDEAEAEPPSLGLPQLDSFAVSNGNNRKRNRNGDDMPHRAAKKRRIAMADTNEPPDEYCDPITFKLMEEPTMVTLTGYTYEKATIMQCIRDNGEDPFTRQKINSSHLVVNRALKSVIDRWRGEHE